MARAGAGRAADGDDRVGVHVIDVAVVDETMQRRIDAGGARIEVEGAMVVEPDHVIFLVGASVDRPQAMQLVHVKRCEAIQLDAADIAARALYP